ncbi:hypothetical protein C8039_16720 [Halogeometricum sp. wsp3]|nr:hypothetical protein C8039_16720 [Halogeometricum sp. wsp3]
MSQSSHPPLRPVSHLSPAGTAVAPRPTIAPRSDLLHSIRQLSRRPFADETADLSVSSSDGGNRCHRSPRRIWSSTRLFRS